MNPFDPKRGRAGASPAREGTPRHEPLRRPQPSVSRSEEDDARSSSKYRAALEALFAKKEAPPAADSAPSFTPERSSVKMVTVPTRDDPRKAEREKRLAKLLAAEGRAAVTKAVDDFVGAGFDLPRSQEVMLKVLDCSSDDRVRAALDGLAQLLADEPPQRKPLLEGRLRRLEDDSDDPDVRALASSLRRKLRG